MYDTKAMGGRLNQCDSIEELKEDIIPDLQNQRDLWMEKLREILVENDLSCGQLSKLCDVSETTVRKWLKGALPQKRELYIRIGFAAGYGLDGMNYFLQKFGRYPQLYVKSLEDSVCIFVLQSEKIEHTYEAYQELLKMVKSEISNNEYVQQKANTTKHLSRYLGELTSMEEMIEFAKVHAPSFREAYSRLYSYVNAYIYVNLAGDGYDLGDQRKPSFNGMAEESGWPSSLRHCISEIHNKHWFPLRHQVISLGLLLNMDVEDLNTMLGYAQMEPLYVKNPMEAAIIWAIENMKLDSEEDEIGKDGSSDLFNYVKDVLEQLDMSIQDEKA